VCTIASAVRGVVLMPARAHRYISALTIGMSYLLGGLIPLIPYFIEHNAHRALLYVRHLRPPPGRATADVRSRHRAPF
jgi:hypothetical protein